MTVAVIDTGASIDHPDLEANIWADPVEALNGIDDDLDAVADDLHGYDFVNDDAEPDDDQGHGTHVAGTIGAVGDNGIGITGVSWDVGLMPLKAGDEEGELALFDVLEAMEYAVAHGARVVNASYVSAALCLPRSATRSRRHRTFSSWPPPATRATTTTRPRSTHAPTTSRT